MNHFSFRFILIMVALVTALILSACNLDTSPEVTPTLQLISTTQAPSTATPSPSPTSDILTATVQKIPLIASATQAVTDGPPTATLEPTLTPGPYVHVLQAGQTLGGIIQIYGYGYEPHLFAEIVALNDNMFSADLLPLPGSEILIPRQTATPIPQGIELTLTLDAELGLGERIGDIVLPNGAIPGCHTVAEGETIIDIAEFYSTNLEILSQLNRDLYWYGCDFTQYSGGPGCGPNIVIGQCVNVPLPTPVPTSSPTPTGLETATPFPTYRAPLVSYPPNGALAPAGVFQLQWVSVGMLKSNEAYLVEVEDRTSETKWLEVSRNTSILLPGHLVPTDGQVHEIQWRVSVVAGNESDIYDYAGAVGPWQDFRWSSR